jgi:hypothetical protein
MIHAAKGQTHRNVFSPHSKNIIETAQNFMTAICWKRIKNLRGVFYFLTSLSWRKILKLQPFSLEFLWCYWLRSYFWLFNDRTVWKSENVLWRFGICDWDFDSFLIADWGCCIHRQRICRGEEWYLDLKCLKNARRRLSIDEQFVDFRSVNHRFLLLEAFLRILWV